MKDMDERIQIYQVGFRDGQKSCGAHVIEGNALQGTFWLEGPDVGDGKVRGGLIIRIEDGRVVETLNYLGMVRES